MAINGAPDSIFLGGSYSNGPAAGVYRVMVQEAAKGEGKTSGRPQIILDLFGKDDPDHPAKKGKRVIKLYQSLPMDTDDKDKADTMKGMVKRMVFDGFGVEWPEKHVAIDLRQFTNKEAWILIGPRVDDRDGSTKNQVIAIAQDKNKLPKAKAAAGAVEAGAKPSRRRGGATAQA